MCLKIQDATPARKHEGRLIEEVDVETHLQDMNARGKHSVALVPYSFTFAMKLSIIQYSIILIRHACCHA